MMEGWNTYTLEQACERIYSGGTPSTKYPEYWNGNLKWLSSGETSQRFIYDTERKITQEGVNNSSTKLAKKGCTVIATARNGERSTINGTALESEALHHHSSVR